MLIAIRNSNTACMQLIFVRTPTSARSHSSIVPAGSSSWPSRMGASCLLRMAFLMSLLLSAAELSTPLFLLLLRPMLEQRVVIVLPRSEELHMHFAISERADDCCSCSYQTGHSSCA